MSAAIGGQILEQLVFIAQTPWLWMICLLGVTLGIFWGADWLQDITV